MSSPLIFSRTVEPARPPLKRRVSPRLGRQYRVLQALGNVLKRRLNTSVTCTTATTHEDNTSEHASKRLKPTEEPTLALFDLPPEILLHMLTFLPIHSLLSFSLTSRTAHTLSLSSLHTLSLGIYPNRIACLISQISRSASAGHTLPVAPWLRDAHHTTTHTMTALDIGGGTASHTTHATHSTHHTATSADMMSGSGNTNAASALSSISSLARIMDADRDPYIINTIIPSGASHRAGLMHAFSAALTSATLSRYSVGLRRLDLTIWTLSMPVAEALAGLSGLRSLGLRLEDPLVNGTRRGLVPREDVAGVAERMLREVGEGEDGEEGLGEEARAWERLAGCWMRVERLCVEGAEELRERQAVRMVKASSRLREVAFKRCGRLGKGFWRFLNTWEGRGEVEALGFVGCGKVDEEALEAVEEMRNLKFLSLYGCTGVSHERLKELNDEKWHVKDLFLPQSQGFAGIPDVIEVDPAYM